MTDTATPHDGEHEDPSPDPSAQTGHEPPDHPMHGSLTLTVHHPVPKVCVMRVEGELDMLTAPRLDACARDQLAAAPAHLILDLQLVSFLGSNGLSCLLEIRQLVQQTATQLHLAGLITRAVARPLEVTDLLRLFNVYPTLTDALTALVG